MKKYKSSKEAGKIKCFVAGSLILFVIIIGIAAVIGLAFCLTWLQMKGIPYLFKNYKWVTLTTIGTILFIFISFKLGKAYYEEVIESND